MRSKKRSGTSTARRKRPHVTFFLDRCLESHSLIDALTGEGADIQRHSALFAVDAPDTERLPEVGRRGWVVLSKDKHIRRNELERQAFLGANVRAIILTAGELTGREMAALFVKHLRKMSNMAVSEPAPFVASVTGSEVRIMDRGGRR